VDKNSFDRLVLDLRDAQLRGSAAIRLLEELDALPARELVLDLHQVADDLLPKVAAVARFLGVNRLTSRRSTAPLLERRLQTVREVLRLAGGVHSREHFGGDAKLEGRG